MSKFPTESSRRRGLPRKHRPIHLLAFILLLGMAVADRPSSPVFGVTIPDGYRQWEIIAPSQDEKTGDIWVIPGNCAAMKAYRDAGI